MTSSHILLNKHDFIKIAKGQRLIGLDPGSKRMGFAISDRAWQVATALDVWDFHKFTPFADALMLLMHQRVAGGLIIGLPLDQTGDAGKKAQSSKALAHNLSRYEGWHWPILLWDERHSTKAMNDMLIQDFDLSRAKRSAVIDQLAAQFILQGCLDHLRL